MRHVIVVLVASVLMALLATLPVQAANLNGHLFYIYHNLSTGNATLYIFSANGTLCGGATLAGIGPPGVATATLQMNMDVLLSEPPGMPNHFGTWYTAGAPGTPCGGATTPLNSWYMTVF